MKTVLQILGLLVCAVVTQDFVQRTNSNEDELRRIAPLFDELANRARITRRHLRGDAMLQLHVPGLLNALDGADKLGPAMGWRITPKSPPPALKAKCTSRSPGRMMKLSSGGRMCTIVWHGFSKRFW